MLNVDDVVEDPRPDRIEFARMIMAAILPTLTDPTKPPDVETGAFELLKEMDKNAEMAAGFDAACKAIWEHGYNAKGK